MHKRIALAGAQGTGKTTLASEWSKESKVPLVQASTRSFMPDGVKTHLDVLKMAVNDPQKGIDFQSKIIESRNALFKKTLTPFISDRSVFDSFAYYVMHNSMYDTKEHMKKLNDITIQSFRSTDCVIVLNPAINSDVGGDGVRIENPYYAMATSNVILNLTVNAIGPSMEFMCEVSDDLFIHLKTNPILGTLAIFNEPNGLAPIKDRIEGIRLVEYHLNTKNTLLHMPTSGVLH